MPAPPASGAEPRPHTPPAPARGSEYAELSRQVRQAGLTYTEATLLGSYTQALRHLHAIGRLTRPVPAPPRSPAPIQP